VAAYRIAEDQILRLAALRDFETAYVSSVSRSHTTMHVFTPDCVL
jgi:hypothetical protein